jgi:uncharacterized protein (UPF0335 family)
MTLIGNLVTKFTADMTDLKAGIAQYGRELDQAEKENADFKKGLDSILMTVAKVTGVITIAAAAIYSAVTRYGSMAQQLKDLSYQTGLSTDRIQKMQYAAVLAGTDFGRVAVGLNALSLSMAEAQDPASAAYKAFLGLGVDPRGKTVDQVFELTARAMVGMRDESKRNESAMVLYGRSWKEILPYLETYITKSKKIKDHPILSKEDVQTLQDGKVALDKLTTSLDLYTAKLVLLAEKGFNPTGGAPIPSRGMTAIKGEPSEATGIMARIFGPLTPSPESPPGPDTAALEAAAAREKKQIDLITDAFKEEIKAVEDLTDEKKRLNDMDKDFTREMSLKGWDVAGARELTIRHQWAEQDQAGRIAEAQSAVQKSALNLGSAAARASGDLIIYLDGKELKRVKGVISLDGQELDSYLNKQVKIAGIPS